GALDSESDDWEYLFRWSVPSEERVIFPKPVGSGEGTQPMRGQNVSIRKARKSVTPSIVKAR
ncbi:MAG: hypothetical protein PHQ43_09010, partial [Dehalococcoidales bacterium]|nr:hypothetical protein [Dehalococcoidales bacterium]